MKLNLYNTLIGKKEEFRSLEKNLVRMYTCGPTVYNFAHIGNLRAYVFADVLRRTLKYNGYKVKQVMNITDIGHLTSDADDGDDKMVKALKREGKPMTLDGLKEIADKYKGEFVSDLKRLNIELPEEMPRASEHVSDDVALIERLMERGVAYTINDGVYFDVSRFPSYGTRGGFALGKLKEGARVSVNVEKHTSQDFSLWKFSKDGIGWESPWGRGFPGWHIECSSMSRKYLGQPFDIHTGGIDHIPVHHQNEIAQSEAAYGAPLANYWMHNEFINITDGKMAKSGDNFLTLRTIVDKGIHSFAYRYWLLTAHYRSPVNFTWKALLAGRVAYRNLLLDFFALSGKGIADSVYKKRFERVIYDDLNTPEGIALLWILLKDPVVSDADKRATILDFDRVLGLDIKNQSALLKKEEESVPDYIKALAHRREEARKLKNFKEADTIRDKIEAAGFEIMDTDSTPVIRKKMKV